MWVKGHDLVISPPTVLDLASHRRHRVFGDPTPDGVGIAPAIAINPARTGCPGRLLDPGGEDKRSYKLRYHVPHTETTLDEVLWVRGYYRSALILGGKISASPTVSARAEGTSARRIRGIREDCRPFDPIIPRIPRFLRGGPAAERDNAVVDNVPE